MPRRNIIQEVTIMTAAVYTDALGLGPDYSKGRQPRSTASQSGMHGRSWPGRLGLRPGLSKIFETDGLKPLLFMSLTR